MNLPYFAKEMARSWVWYQREDGAHMTPPPVDLKVSKSLLKAADGVTIEPYFDMDDEVFAVMFRGVNGEARYNRVGVDEEDPDTLHYRLRWTRFSPGDPGEKFRHYGGMRKP